MFNIKFKDFKPFVARLERLSICMKETMQYENFICLKDVPEKYDEYYVYGIGSIESEFYQISEYEYLVNKIFIATKHFVCYNGSSKKVPTGGFL